MNTRPEVLRADGAFPSQGRSWLIVILFGLCNAVSFMDRSFLNLVLEPVRKYFALSDTQMGVLIGPVFMLCYSLVALPLGAFADTANRKRMIIGGVVFWSICTGLFGLARNYVVMASVRMGVGLGEATLTPAAVSIISDYFPRTKVGRAVSLFTAMAAIGSSAALIVGGMLMKALTALGPINLPLVGAMLPWQMAFVIISTPGLLLGLLIGLIAREPTRRSLLVGRPAHGAGWAATFRYLGQNPLATITLIIGLAIISAGAAGSAWMATLFARAYGWGPAQAGPYLGAVQLFSGFPGVLAGGYLADRLRQLGREDANVIVALAGLLIALPCDLLIPNAGNPYLSLAAMVPATFCTMMCFGAATPALPLVTPPQFRAKLVSLYLVAGNIVGIGLGPVLVPLCTDYLFHRASALRYSMTLVPAILFPIAILLLAISRRPYRDQVVRLREAA